MKGLKQQIIQYLKNKGDEATLSELYEHFDNVKHTTIRGRINEDVGTKFIRTGKGTYMLLGAEIEAVIEKTDSRLAMPEIIKANIYYDLMFFDIPYKTGGQKGGNRDLSNYEMIEPEEFEKIINQAQKMLRTEDSQIYFMIAGGTSSKAAADKYIRAFAPTDLKVAGRGSYLKLNANGTVCNMGKYLMPAEEIYIFNHSGKLQINEEIPQLDFQLTRPPLPKSGGYPTQKPLELMKQIIKQSTNIGDRVLDMFGGSGVTLEACLMLKRFIHTMDISDEAIKRMISIANRFTRDIIAPVNNVSYEYDKESLMAFQSGRLF